MESPEIFETRTKLTDLQNAIEKIRNEIAKIVVGQGNMVDLLITAMFSNGHVLLEGVPGVAKTMTAKLIARSINTGFSR
ncbi:MAG TPA: MoxR family ATPase, partial [Bacteroidia bacterium]|nr:MoxR family ATPase [Bacteroidia bacterium]